MACISELAYVKFNPIFKDSTKDYIIKKVSELAGDGKVNSLNVLIETIGYDADKKAEKLKENASFLNLELIQTF